MQTKPSKPVDTICKNQTYSKNDEETRPQSKGKRTTVRSKQFRLKVTI